jgi:hypothetical protein
VGSVSVGYDPSRIGKEHSTYLGKAGTGASALEQGNVEFVLERSNLTRHDRLAHADHIGCAAKAQFVGCSQKVAETAQSHFNCSSNDNTFVRPSSSTRL